MGQFTHCDDYWLIGCTILLLLLVGDATECQSILFFFYHTQKQFKIIKYIYYKICLLSSKGDKK